MKIGIVLYPTFGGSGVVATELGKALAKKGHEIHFITYSQPVRLGGFIQNVFYHEVSVTDYPLFDFQPYETELASKMVDVVKYEKLDLIHVHYAIPHASAAFMAKQILRTHGINIPYVTTLHGTDITLVGRDPSFEPVITFCINESDAVTAVSESLKRDTLKHFNIKNDITVIPNFISLDKKREDSEINRSLYATDEQRILCHVSNFRKVKRVEDVIRIFAKTIKKVPSKLLFVGDGPERYRCEQLCRELSLCEHILFLGKIRDTSGVLAISDVFVLPSETESFGLAALEAMAMGVPVISSNSGGIPEVNIHGFSGYLSDVGDVDDMANNLLDILDENNLNRFRANALKQAGVFTISKILPMYEDIYTKLVK
ncbi:MAG: N-acetyl-alpha-D-glucosaminyl L-malate synthase BshA [Crocinitomicaceae bacterium]|jgi:N-acetyl-alpha-D-glucosaminyl L-malate synthase BshA|tara:strand:- start:9020 stop:10135 length:1116 start_codon:yes stop_codon:yes gene_type:complete